MPLNDRDQDEFSTHLEDEEIFDAHYPPGVEIGALELARDYGSGSYAEDGRLEVAEDRLMMDGENQVGSAAMYGPTEIGNMDEVGDDVGTVGDFDDELGAAAAADRDGFEIGSAAAADREGSEIGYGYAPMDGQSEIGYGYAPMDGQSEIGEGHAAADGQSEIGRANQVEPFESFMMGPTRMGAGDFGVDAVGNMDEVGWGEYDDEIGAAAAADREGSEIVGASVAKVIEKARDNRQPPPPMRAVDVDAPAMDDEWTDELTETLVGAAAASGNPDPFPLTSDFMLRCGAGGEPRYVRVDTEESYKKFRTEHSPELAELSARLEAHIADPHAHGDRDLEDDLSDDIDDLVHLGAEAQATEDAKRLELWMPRRFDGLVTGWREGDFVCASMTLPGQDGELRICTSLEPVRKCVTEMSRHASEAGVPASTVVGVLPAMGCVLGVGTALKEMAAAAPAILKRPEAAGKESFMVRIEPKTSPALAALAMLVMACRAGNAQACTEWKNLSALAPAPVKQAMSEAVQIAKAAA